MADNKSNKTKAVKKITSQSLPAVDDLKTRFKAGSIPLQSDFSDLIDLANVGRLAVGDEKTGFGLNKDKQQRLTWDASQIYNVTVNLSDSDNERIQIPHNFSGSEKTHNQIALLALESSNGPTKAVMASSDSSTRFTVRATLKDGDGNQLHTKADIIATKFVGKTAAPIPFQLLLPGEATYSLWYDFVLDTTDFDYTNHLLFIDPLILSIHHIPDFYNDPIGEVLSLMIVNFTFNSSYQLIPKGLISMFSGAEIPRGWALCDGSEGTPDLVDRFILGGNTSHSGEHSDEIVSGEGNNKHSTLTTDSAGGLDSKNAVKVDGHALTMSEMPSHSHIANIQCLAQDRGFYNPTLYQKRNVKSDLYQIYQTEARGNLTAVNLPITETAGNNSSHSHTASISIPSHTHTAKLVVPYYILAFIIKT